MAATTASFVIDFGGVENAFLQVALDEIKNSGKTTFAKGDSVHFKVFTDVAYTIEVTAGTISDGITNVPILVGSEILSFIKGEPASVSNKLVSIDSTYWYGNNLGAITAVSVSSVQAANATEDTLGIASINYYTEYNEHTLVPPVGMTDVYHIIVYLKAVL